MSKERVLIVGAGALGLSCAYHLQMAGASISFLVRPHRREALSRPQGLYCYDDHSLKQLQDYETIVDADSLKGRQFDFVLLTLDGALCRSDAGVATLNALGERLCQSDAVMIICGVGIGLYEHVQGLTGFPSDRLCQGSLGMLAYQVDRANMPLHAPVDQALHDRADIAYHHFSNRLGFFMSSQPAKASKAFSRLYNRCGISRCKRALPTAYAIISNVFFPLTTASEVNGWRGTESLIADTELWRLTCASMREIVGLEEHGWLGKVGARVMSDKRIAKTLRGLDADSMPLDFTAFNHFHHGGKVQAQDIQVMENCQAAGERQGRSMSATAALLARWREHREGK